MQIKYSTSMQHFMTALLVFHSDNGGWVAMGSPSAPAEPSPACSYTGFFSTCKKAGCEQQEKEMAPLLSIP